MTEKQAKQRTQNVDENLSPIYQPLQPEWNDSTTVHRPLTARGDFSNAWVVYDQGELPAHVGRPTALGDPDSSTRQTGQKKE